ncbi:16S rRNA (cytidine(1402)-2'-O)-methyltransferase [Candidatus Curtissbacteria bacterium RIFCSPLOWO2_01_FULL_42_26]|uniref:Ribosomal RNA small subunit methyltransferase I n=1 Tax=Candidatus Curtissbacteria bacterium RIFCSPLOWO2_01_FULL_42_26 TaxID=1797729 RepID=A0A1F5I391_9BACT|nr:MAG: 16S rRNA (cytidine(1402)-2'-O)-methyltransferase [Candidatus Curtissbacteria bacterium RIFCSPLOWO2_01_FULL_42_26]
MGILYIVSTPIGNLADITLRAIETLKSVDLVVCEDTRVTGKLLKHFEIEKPMIILNDFNEVRQVSLICSRLLAGESLALVSDAGTPLISDPGFKMVREAIEKGIKVESIPGPSAVIAALTVSGLPPDKFTYVSYLPKKDGKRKKFLEDLKTSRQIVKSTIIAFESPFRLLKTLANIKEVFGDIEIVICRELTKMHEEIFRGYISESQDHFSKAIPKGELTLLW